MLLALVLLGLIALWWVGRNGGRLPFRPTPRRLWACAAFALALLLGLRGRLDLFLLFGAAGLWLFEGTQALKGRLSALLATVSPRRTRPVHRYRTATVELDITQDGIPRDGTVLAGPHAGTLLSAVPVTDLVALRALCRDVDAEGARLLEAYLDRRHPAWRVDAERDAHAGPRGPLQPGSMTEEEAYQILGLERGAPLEEVRAAHRRLMLRLHPDQGGSAGGAARVNAARDRLTNRHR